MTFENSYLYTMNGENDIQREKINPNFFHTSHITYIVGLDLNGHVIFGGVHGRSGDWQWFFWFFSFFFVLEMV